MQNRYRVAWDITGWAVIDTLSGRLADIDGLPLIGLPGEVAERAARTLNGLVENGLAGPPGRAQCLAA